MSKTMLHTEAGLPEGAVVDPDRDEAYFRSQQDRLLRDYANKFVAVRDQQVVATANTYFDLHAQLCARYGQPVYALVRRVVPSAFQARDTDPVNIVL
ncbi:MAG: hypothetical protein KF886_08555 [Candidatus Hydrogenedentes bacterium]|nr:hypothetical protein [Candidatus Hydrogenedentota bacterium]